MTYPEGTEPLVAYVDRLGTLAVRTNRPADDGSVLLTFAPAPPYTVDELGLELQGAGPAILAFVEATGPGDELELYADETVADLVPDGMTASPAFPYRVLLEDVLRLLRARTSPWAIRATVRAGAELTLHLDQLDALVVRSGFRSGLTVEELARALSVGVSATGPVRDRLELAIATADDAVGHYTGRPLASDWSSVPPGAKVAALQVASRVYRAVDVAYGVLQTELGTSWTGRWITPEVGLSLLGYRRRFGIA